MSLNSNDVANALFITPEDVRSLVRNKKLKFERKLPGGGNLEFSTKNICDYVKKNDIKRDCTTISLANIKGGVGKTLSTICISSVLKECGYRVLVIDCDKQANMTAYFIEETSDLDMPNASDIFFGRFSDKVIYETKFGVHIIPSNLQFAEIMDITAVTKYTNLYNFIETIKDDYDFILIDTPPDILLPVEASLIASHFVFCVIQPDYASFLGIKYLYDLIDNCNKSFVPPDCSFGGCFFNQVLPNRKLDKQFLENQEQIASNVRILENYITHSNSYREFQAFREPIMDGLKDRYINSFVSLTLEILSIVR